MNRHQRMKNRETARNLGHRVRGAHPFVGGTVSIAVDHGAPGGDRYAVAFIEVGRVVDVFDAADYTRRFWPLQLEKGGAA